MNRPAHLPLRTALTTTVLLEGRFSDGARRRISGKAALYADRVELRRWVGWRWKRERIVLAEFSGAEWTERHDGKGAEVRLPGRPRRLRFEEPERWQRMIGATLKASRAPQQPTRSNSTLLFA